MDSGSHGDTYDLNDRFVIRTKHAEAKSALIAIDLYDADKRLKRFADRVYRDI